MVEAAGVEAVAGRMVEAAEVSAGAGKTVEAVEAWVVVVEAGCSLSNHRLNHHPSSIHQCFRRHGCGIPEQENKIKA